MNQDLATMQKHLTLAREQTRELRIENSALQVQAYESNNRLVKTKRRYTIAVVALVVVALWIGYVNMQYAADVRWSSDKLRETKDLQQRFDNVLRMLHYQNARVLQLEEANDALTTHCKPRDVLRAIKATPLPALVLS